MTITKTCSTCGRELPTTEYYPYRAGGTRLRPICIECTKIANEANRKARKARINDEKAPKITLIGTEKQCLRCKEVKDLAFFDKNAREKDGRQLYCKDCRAYFNRIYTQGEK